MSISSVALTPEMAAEIAAFNAQAEPLLASLPGPHEVPIAQQRAQNAETAPPRLPEGRDEMASANGLDVPVRVFEPPTITGAYLHIHGGGWTMGAADRQDPQLWRISCEANVVVVSVDYRLAPEHPHPAASDDCLAAATWLAAGAHARWGVDRVVIGGESAGAHLSALTLVRWRDQNGTAAPFAGANLSYGMYDLGLTDGLRAWGERNMILSRPIVEWHLDQLLPGVDTAGRRAASASPLFASLHDLPPALLTVGTCDPTMDDSLLLADAWRAAGSDVQLAVYDDCMHAFNLFPLAVAEVANRAQIEFVAAEVSR